LAGLPHFPMNFTSISADFGLVMFWISEKKNEFIIIEKKK
jgi:hypothetical protein